MALFGLSIGIGALFMALGVLIMFVPKVRGFLKAVPLVSKLPYVIVAIALFLVGFSAGGIGWYQSTLQGATASITGNAAAGAAVASAAVISDSYWSAAPTGSAAATSENASLVTKSLDVNDDSHYTLFLINATNMGAAIYTANITLQREDVSKAQAITCYAKADTFRSETSTTDTNVYYIVETSTAKSQVEGVPWQQTIYLANGVAAGTGSNKEKVSVTFAEGTAQTILGVYVKLPGDTSFNYLTGSQATPSIRVYCGGQQVGVLTFDKERFT